MLQVVISKVKEFILKLNEFGVPLPMVRSDGKASLTATMTAMSFTTALFGQLGKIANLVGDVDLTQSNYLFLICLGAYVGRKFQGNGTTKTGTLEGATTAKDDSNGQ